MNLHQTTAPHWKRLQCGAILQG